MGVFTLTAIVIGEPRTSGVRRIRKVTGGTIAPDGRPVFLLYIDTAPLRMSAFDRNTVAPTYCTPLKYR